MGAASECDVETVPASRLGGDAPRVDEQGGVPLQAFCLGRGEHLYGRPDHDTDSFRDLLGEVALGGFFCNGEIGPVHGRTFLHGYTSSFAIFRAV